MLEPNFSAWMITAASDAEVLDARADAQVAEHVLARPAHLDLEVGDRELLAEDRAGRLPARSSPAASPMSRPSPASTQTTIRSSASGRPRKIDSIRASSIWLTTKPGT